MIVLQGVTYSQAAFSRFPLFTSLSGLLRCVRHALVPDRISIISFFYLHFCLRVINANVDILRGTYLVFAFSYWFLGVGVNKAGAGCMCVFPQLCIVQQSWFSMKV